MAVLLGFLVLIVDAGFAYAARRDQQNGADNAALAATRLVGSDVKDDAAIKGTIDKYVDAHGGQVDWAKAPAYYVDKDKKFLGYVGAGAVPQAAQGVGVITQRQNNSAFFFSLLPGGNDTYDVAAHALALAQPGKRVTSMSGLIPLAIPHQWWDGESVQDYVVGEEYDIWNPQYAKIFPHIDWGSSNFKGVVNLGPYSQYTICEEQNETQDASCFARYGLDGTVEIDDRVGIINGDVGNNIGGKEQQDSGLIGNVLEQNLDDGDGKGKYGIVYVLLFDEVYEGKNHKPA